MISFACPGCCTTFEVSDRKIGSKFNCDVCGKRIQVPSPPKAASAAKNSRPSVAPPVDTDVFRSPTSVLPELARPTVAAPARGPSAVGLLAIVAIAASVLLAVGGGILLTLASRARPPHKAVDGQAAVPAPTNAEPSVLTDAAVQARVVLKTNCYRCHGESGTAEGGFNFILDRNKLVARKKVVPGNAAASKLYRRVAEGEMPPADETPRPDDAAVAVLKRWIDEGATPFAREAPQGDFVSDEQLVAILHDDLLSVPERDRKFIRYFTTTHLANAHLSSDELKTWRHALAKLINSLSWNKDVVPLHDVGTSGTVFRVDIRDYSWNERLWSDVLASYPYGVLQNSSAARDLLDAAGGRLSYVRADWFIATASRPPLYHDLLQLPDNERKLEDQLHIDLAEDIEQERMARAGFNGSGVSRNNRLIERHESPYGSYWRSYDFAGNSGTRNLFSCPLGVGPAAAPEADGGEIIFNLPNGLHAFMLVDGKGRRLEKASLAIVSDARRPDRAVEDGVSCMNCHARGLIAKGDQVRASVERNPNAFTAAEADTVRALYPPEATLKALFAKDNQRFARAVEATGARLTATEPIASLVGQFEKDMDMTTAAAELGLSPAELTERLDQSATLARTLGPLKIPGGSVQRQVFTDAFPEMVRELNRGTYLAPEAIERR